MPGIDHAPPPFFKRGPAPLALLSFYVATSLALFVVDLKYHSVDFLRQGIAVLVDPMHRLAQTPAATLAGINDYFGGIHRLQQENSGLRRAQLDTAPRLGRLAHLESENENLRQLLGMKAREKAQGLVASILYATRDPFARRIVINKGIQDGITPGRPVIDAAGVIGQVTRTTLMHAEVTLISDKNQVVPVQIARTGMRSIVYGLGDGMLELRYLPANADIKEGDMLVTSGLDGVFLPGFPVARVEKVERDSAYTFARILCHPAAGVEHHGEVFVLATQSGQTPIPAELAGKPSGKTTVQKQRNAPPRKP